MYAACTPSDADLIKEKLSKYSLIDFHKFCAAKYGL